MYYTRELSARRSSLAFVMGCVAVTIGVLLHLPMFFMARHAHYALAGMPMDTGMLCGMWAIVVGTLFAAYGLLPVGAKRNRAIVESFHAPETAPMTRRHVSVLAVMSLALVIDIMKPASLGLVIPGMRSEYQIDGPTVAWLPTSALAGTALGSILWGAISDLYGRRAAILLAAVMFVGTSICGAMPSFWWNVGMCFMMGLGAGGMLPVAYALVAEVIPTRHRGWSLVLIGGIGTLGGLLAANVASALLQPHFGWRALWLINLPTGLLLILLSPALPESPRFLQQQGRIAEALAIMARFGLSARPDIATENYPAFPVSRPVNYVGLTAALTLSGLIWSLINFGVLLWIPGVLVSSGHDVAAVSALFAHSAFIGGPAILVSVWLYSAWSSKGTLILASVAMASGLFAMLVEYRSAGALTIDTVNVTALIIGSSGVISMLLPYTAEQYPLRVRGLATGWIGACTKIGGLVLQALTVAGLISAIAILIALVGILIIASCVLLLAFGNETRGCDLRLLEAGVGSRS